MLLITTMFPVAQDVRAQSEPPYTGADFVFIVDQSGSMGGEEYGSTDHPRPNDRQELRFKGLRLFVAPWLGRRLLEKDPENRFTFRLGVVYFGDRTEKVNFGEEDVPLWFTTIAPASEEEWSSLKADLEEHLPTSEEWRGRNLGNTNFQQALKEARDLFSLMEDEDDSQRIKAVILITDGWPVVFMSSGDKVSISSRLNGVVEYVEENLPYPDYQLYVLGLNDSDTSYWRIVERYWQQASQDQATKIEGNANFFWKVQDILNQITRPLQLGKEDKLIQCGPNFIPPYLDLVRFTFHKIDPTDEIRVFAPDGQEVKEPEAIVHGHDEPIETFTVERPQPGTWRLECPTGVSIPPKIYKREIDVNVSLSTSSAHQYLPVHVDYKIVDSRGVPVTEYADPRYPLHLHLNLVNSGETLTSTLTKGGDGQYAADFLPTASGDYELHLVGTSYGITTTHLITVLEDITDLPVDETRPELQAPQDATQLVPAEFSIALVDSEGEMIAFPDDSHGTLHVETDALVSCGAEEHEILLDLEEVGEEEAQDAVFVGSFSPEQQGEYSVSMQGKIEYPGSIGQVSFEKLAGRFNVGPIQAAWSGFTNPPQQYIPVRIAYELTDQAGQPLVEALAPGYVLSATVGVDAGTQSWTLPLEQNPDSVFAAQFRPILAQRHSQHLMIEALDTTGGKTVLLDDDRDTFAVTPTTLVRYKVIRPADKSKSERRTWYFRPKPLIVEMELQDEDGQPLDPASVLRDPTLKPFSATVRSPDGGVADVEWEWTNTGKRGRYRLLATGLDALGWYEVEVETDPTTLKTRHVYDEPQRTTSVERVENRVLAVASKIAPPLGGVILLVVLVYAGVLASRWFGPKLEGTIAVEGPEGTDFSRNLGGWNTKVFRRRELSGTGLKKLIVKRPSGSPDIIRVTAVLKRGGVKVLNNTPMTGGARAPIGEEWLTYSKSKGGTSYSSAGTQSSMRWRDER
jgi:hypothetical protein